MKYKNLYYGLLALVMTAAVLMKIAHIPYADLLLTTAFVAGILLQSRHIFELEQILNRPSFNKNQLNKASLFLIIGAAALKIAHFPFADIILIFAFVASIVIKYRHIRVLEKEVADQQLY